MDRTGYIVETIIPLIVYVLPLFILFYIAIEILNRNYRNLENILLAATFSLYGLLFLAEYVRHLFPIEYSSAFIHYWFGNVGLLIPSVFIHFIYKFSDMHRHPPKYFHPYIFYSPVILILLTIVLQSNLTNSEDFEQVGLFIYPVFNVNYLIAITVGNIIHMFVIVFIFIAKKRTDSYQKQQVFDILFAVAIVILIWDILFGYFDFRGTLPPYSYIYAGLLWAVALRYAMSKYGFIESFYNRFATLFTINPSAIVLVNEQGLMIHANPAAYELIEEEALVGETIETYLAFGELPKGKKVIEYEMKIRTASGQEKHVLIDSDRLMVDYGVVMMLIIRDIDDVKKAEQQVHHMAYHDVLTDLPNRRSFYEQATTELAGQGQLAFMIFDLDDFKGINDQYGHQTGDEFLIHVAQKLRNATRKEAMVARVGGDEFHLCLPYSELDDVHIMVKRIFIEMQEPFAYQGNMIPVQASIGVSLAPVHSTNLEQLIHYADEAMYMVKKGSKNDYRIF